jgi:tetratricopeptide (TPR) repeat protein
MKFSILSCAVLLLAGSTVVHADDLDDAFQALKDAQAKNDTALVKKWAVETSTLAGKVIQSPAPQDEGEKEAWTKMVAYAKDLQLNAEYALFTSSLQAQPAVAVDLLSTLEKLNPKSKYFEEGYSRYFAALQQTGASARLPAVAQKALENFPDNEDALLILAESAMNRQQNAQALSYANRLVAAIGRHSKPEGVSAAEWERKRSNGLARGHYIAGMMYAANNQYFQANASLRLALPLVKGNESMLGATLFQLGVVNYQLGRATGNKAQVQEAIRFSEEAAKIKGPYAAQAWRNAGIMRTDLAKMR